ncbi:hypothetical protein [Limnoglobus roseus]|uniref:Uncharacterized protein n=1 Tax=Limnoglobus roseus TaxID=2598579 RepID=A0A5C1ASX5_9BACT|nr:hypothetical protein [Limnoglobus roseus]QEL20682.1 hypothetical protein PX52LOC_07789 [Limnoglobus roseus]
MATTRTSLATHFSHLSPPWQRVFRTCQAVGFGSVEGLGVRRGEPVFGPGCVARHERKLGGGDAGGRPPIDAADFQLKLAHVELIQEFARLPDGAGVTVEVRHGLPARLVRVETLA